MEVNTAVRLVKIARCKESAFYHNIDALFNHLARDQKEADLRELEKLWNEFIRTGDITIHAN
jgi:hypothetical protein